MANKAKSKATPVVTPMLGASSHARKAMSIDTGDAPVTKKDLDALVKKFKTNPPPNKGGVMELSRNDIERIASVLKPVMVASGIGSISCDGNMPADASTDFTHKSYVDKQVKITTEAEPDKISSPVEQENHDLRTELIVATSKVGMLISQLHPLLPNTDSMMEGDKEDDSVSNLWDSSPVPMITDIRNNRREVYRIQSQLTYLLRNLTI